MPDAAITQPVLVNWALTELGQAPNFSIDAQSRLGALVDIYWPRAVARCFGLTDWPFCRRTYRLTRLADAPDTGYAYAFQLPNPRYGPPLRYLRDPRSNQVVRDTRIEGEEVHADEPVLHAACKVAVDPEYWDEQFADCFAVALASYLAVPLLQDADMAEMKSRQAFGTPSEGGAGGMFGRLIAQHRASGPMAAPGASDALSGGRADGQWFGRW
jgi:hypothetical protein